MEARFVGGPLDGQLKVLEHPLPYVVVFEPPTVEHLTVLPLWIEGHGIADASGSFIKPNPGLYERDGLPSEPPYVYTWRG